MDSVLIVVLNWNGMADTRHCLASIAKQTYQNFKIVLIDNNSSEKGTAESLDELEREYKPNIHIIRNNRNSGFAGGVNIGIKYGLQNGFGYIALLNNDATVQQNWLEQLVKTSNEVGSSITTGLLLHDDGQTIDSTGDWYSAWGLPFPRDRNKPRSQASKAGKVFSASGGASLYRSSFFNEIGLFDETFFAYYEDVDICFRAQLQGHSVYYTDAAIAYHKRGASSSKRPGFSTYQTLKNLPLLYIKNVPAPLLFTIGRRFFLAYWLIAVNGLRRGAIIAVVKGVSVGMFRFWTHGFSQRRVIQAAQKVDIGKFNTLLWRDLPPEQTGIRKLRSLFTRKP